MHGRSNVASIMEKALISILKSSPSRNKIDLSIKKSVGKLTITHKNQFNSCNTCKHTKKPSVNAKSLVNVICFVIYGDGSCNLSDHVTAI